MQSKQTTAYYRDFWICASTFEQDFKWFNIGGDTPEPQDSQFQPEPIEILQEKRFAHLQGVTVYKRETTLGEIFGCYWSSPPLEVTDRIGRSLRFNVLIEWSEAQYALDFGANLIGKDNDQKTDWEALVDTIMGVARGEQTHAASVREAILEYVQNLPQLPEGGVALSDNGDFLVAADTPKNRSTLVRAMRSGLNGYAQVKDNVLVAVLGNAAPKHINNIAWRAITNVPIEGGKDWVCLNPPQAPQTPPLRSATSPRPRIAQGIGVLLLILGALWLYYRKR